jgi:excisionase family DNA binding protein
MPKKYEPTDEPLIDINKAAKILQVHPMTLYRLVKKGTNIPIVRVGGKLKSKRSWLYEYAGALGK